MHVAADRLLALALHVFGKGEKQRHETFHLPLVQDADWEPDRQAEHEDRELAHLVSIIEGRSRDLSETLFLLGL
jgi:hypothetical protein